MTTGARSTEILAHRAENGEADEVRRAAADYIRSLDPITVRDHFHSAGTVAVYNGNGTAAWKLRDVLNRPESYGTQLTESAIIMLYHHPEFYNYFTPEFADGILSRI